MTHIVQLITTERFEEALQALRAEPSLIEATALDDPDREGVFHYAACSGNLDFMKELILLGGDFDRAAPGVSFGTPLGEAARVGDVAMIELLHANGARIDGADATALSPLMEAAQEAMPDAVGLLLKLRANPNRLGFLQRFLPLDFAGWQDCEECRGLIRAANGLSVTDDFDWHGQPGYAIDVTVSNEIGAVFPLQFADSKDGVSLRLAQLRERPHAIYLFTDELHLSSRVELAFYLAADWGVLAQYADGRSVQSFPVDVLRALGGLIMNGSLVVSEGDVFEKGNSILGNVEWPDGYGALVAINHEAKKNGSPRPVQSGEDCIELLVLAPLRDAGTWRKGPTYLKKAVESLKAASIKKMMLTG